MNKLLSWLIATSASVLVIYTNIIMAAEPNASLTKMTAVKKNTIDAKNIDQTMLSPRAESIVSNAEAIQLGRLAVIEFNKARDNILQNRDVIVGYPISGALKIISKEDADEIKNTLLKRGNYINMRKRCLNSYFIGIRFIKHDDVVEFALGLPCNQVLWAYKSGKEIKTWGATLSHQSVKKIYQLHHH